MYAIGDVHGCAALFRRLIASIAADNAARKPALTRIVVLGDVVDRGPASAEVVAAMMRFARGNERFVVLMGNHEQLMWTALGGDHEALGRWLAVGGDQTLRSWGVGDETAEIKASPALLDAARRAIGPDVALWLERLPLTASSGDLLFVHAGVRPAMLLAAQQPADLLWIRDAFLDSEEARPFLVVHGHSIHAGGPDVRANRIGLDTGAFRTGLLTAMGFQGEERWVLST